MTMKRKNLTKFNFIQASLHELARCEFHPNVAILIGSSFPRHFPSSKSVKNRKFQWNLRIEFGQH